MSYLRSQLSRTLAQTALACFLSLPLTTHASENPTLIVTYPDIYNDYLEFLDGRSPISITEYSGEKSRRDVVELILIQQALHLGGYQHPIAFKLEAFYNRVMHLLDKGGVAAGASTTWDKDANKHRYYVSEPIIRRGEFVAGLYTKTEKANDFEPTQKNIKALTAVSNELWQVDWSALETLGMNKLYTTSEWPSMVRMVWYGRVDVTLAPFQPNDDMSVTFENMRLVPIQGVKVVLPGTRHWLVSKAHPQGKKVFSALEEGIAKLREQGTIARAYRESGFFDHRVDNWLEITPDDLTPYSEKK
ncbi:hypothetical protein [Teredinibacter sp. KSP-S5-2]|uniref:hypothetical protein n=1 Tax=Teredinibacter sp. KSP-S5-2 TaxID=3034506 RepID=UPI0029341F80|nr:hypothetical protein [Teredinibacter sp. KSP-S5-2]WNO11590.1 hypothetical protein P5V12_10445 [Teredinibacter sp. KSP-S5-2]